MKLTYSTFFDHFLLFWKSEYDRFFYLLDQIFMFSFEAYESVKFHFWLGTIPCKAESIQDHQSHDFAIPQMFLFFVCRGRKLCG